MEDHPAGRPLPARRGRLAGRPFGLPHAAQQRTGEKRQYADARRIGAPAPGSPRELQALRIQRYFMDAFQYGKGFSRQILFLRDQAQKRFLDAYDLREDLTRQGAHRARRQSRGARPVRGPNPTHWTARTNCSSTSPPWAATTRDASPCTGRRPRRDSWSPSRWSSPNSPTPAAAQRRGLQRLVHLPEGKRSTLRARSLLRQGRRAPTADDQHRLPSNWMAR